MFLIVKLAVLSSPEGICKSLAPGLEIFEVLALGSPVSEQICLNAGGFQGVSGKLSEPICLNAGGFQGSFGRLSEPICVNAG